VLIFLYWQWIT